MSGPTSTPSPPQSSTERLAAALLKVIDARYAYLNYGDTFIPRQQQAFNAFDSALVERVTEIVDNRYRRAGLLTEESTGQR